MEYMYSKVLAHERRTRKLLKGFTVLGKMKVLSFYLHHTDINRVQSAMHSYNPGLIWRPTVH